MKKPKSVSFEKLSLKAGVIICFAYVIYFIFMKNMNLLEVTELRSLNFVILLVGLYFTFRYYRMKSQMHIEYLKGISLGFFTSLISIVLFAIFILVYFSKIDPLLLQQLKNNAPVMGQYLTPFSAAFTIIIEGGISGLIISFAIMQYYKNDPSYAKQEGEKQSQ